MHEAFKSAGRRAGLEIWRIENFEPVPYPAGDYGKFYTGDSYIVLYTKERQGVFSWDVHFWLGAETSQDESGSAAILTVDLDDQLGGGPVQYREVQDHESQLFLSHFKSGIRYCPGGVASGFTHVDRAAFETVLYHIKGKRNIRVKQVAVHISSMNKGDCFILDTGNEIFVYVGQSSRRMERLKAISAANQVRDQDHGGRSKIIICDESASREDMAGFFAALGSGSPGEVPEESAGGDDVDFESQETRGATLYRVSDAKGSLQTEKIGQKPLQQQMLDTNDCFILATGRADLFVWVGRKCTAAEKAGAMQKAQAFLDEHSYPKWAGVRRIVEGGEPAAFRQYFASWRDVAPVAKWGASGAPAVRKVEKSAGEAAEYMPDDGSGQVDIFRVENFQLQPVDKESHGKFYGGDSYIVKYTNGAVVLLYIWQGSHSTTDEKGSSALHAIRLDNEMNGKAIQIRVTQNHEPKHFLHIFKGKLITYLGGSDSGFKNIKRLQNIFEGKARLFRIRGTCSSDVRASEQPPMASSLQSDDVFLLETEGKVYMWIGKEANSDEKAMAEGFSKQLFGQTSPIAVPEGREPQEFWSSLGGKDVYQTSYEPVVGGDPRLFHCSVQSNGKFVVEEINDFDQSDLFEDDVMILDSGYEVYLWIGKTASKVEIEMSIQMVQDYLRKEASNRETSVIITVKQGNEPLTFKAIFPKWDNKMFAN